MLSICVTQGLKDPLESPGISEYLWILKRLLKVQILIGLPEAKNLFIGLLSGWAQVTIMECLGYLQILWMLWIGQWNKTYQ